MKRYLYILVGIVVIAIIAVVGLYFWKSSSTTSVGTPGSGTTGGLPSTGTQGSNGGTSNGGTAGGNNNGGGGATGGSNGGSTGVVAGSFGPLSNDPVLDYFVQTNNTVLALESNGVIASIANGQTSYLSTSTANNIIGGAFSYDGKKAFLNFGDPANPQTSVFDVATAKWTALPQGMQSPQWSPSDYRIAYVASAATGTERLATIIATSPKGGSSILVALHANDLSLQWVTKTQFVLSDKPSIFAPGSAWIFDSSISSLTPIAIAIPGLESTWSGAGASKAAATTGLLFLSPTTGAGTSLQLVSTQGSVLQNLNVQTLPTKCGFGMASSTTGASSTSFLALFCGIPRDTATFDSARLPDDYNQRALFTSDGLYEINTQTGALSTVWNDTNQNVDVSDLKTANNELFFVDRYTQKLYALTLQSASQ